MWLEGGGRANAARKHLDEDGEVTTGVTLLMDAAENGHERVAELLLQRGAEVNLQNSDGWTALMQAAINGHERVVELLLQRGADANTHSRVVPTGRGSRATLAKARLATVAWGSRSTRPGSLYRQTSR